MYCLFVPLCRVTGMHFQTDISHLLFFYVPSYVILLYRSFPSIIHLHISPLFCLWVCKTDRGVYRFKGFEYLLVFFTEHTIVRLIFQVILENEVTHDCDKPTWYMRVCLVNQLLKWILKVHSELGTCIFLLFNWSDYTERGIWMSFRHCCLGRYGTHVKVWWECSLVNW